MIMKKFSVMYFIIMIKFCLIFSVPRTKDRSFDMKDVYRE